MGLWPMQTVRTGQRPVSRENDDAQFVSRSIFVLDSARAASRRDHRGILWRKMAQGAIALADLAWRGVQRPAVDLPDVGDAESLARRGRPIPICREELFHLDRS